jgi:hypothetical protein
MTKFEELMDIITRNKSKSAKKIAVKEDKEDDDIELEVSGTATRAPLVATANEELDPDLIDMLYSQAKWRNIPNRGEGASPIDSDY